MVWRGDIAARPREIRDEPGADRVADRDRDYRNAVGRLLRSLRRWGGEYRDDVHRNPSELIGGGEQSIGNPIGAAILE